MTDEAVLGIDIGGSSSRARLVAGDRVVAEARGPGANVALIDPKLVEQRLIELIGRLGSPRPVACCAGAAGSEAAAARRRLEELLGTLLPGTKVLVVHDTRLILAAADVEAGIALIAGTGSVAYARNSEGHEARVGGWGWMLGDEGSGSWIVRAALRELMRRREGGEPQGELGDRLLAAIGIADLLETIGHMQGYHEAGQWAAFAGSVFDAAGDPGAVRIIDTAAQSLAQLAGRAGAKVGVKRPVVLAGGLLTNQPDLLTRVQAQIEDSVVLREEPVAGAVRLAQTL